ncbi:acyltransferase family protein [Pedobacter sp. R-06]|uniref:acyltransferase family protein n=1 Tax=Pedobacter sp. R-06 TaxID=3404051 RepID=UPI003CFBBABA
MTYSSIQYLRAFAAFSVIYIHLTYLFFDINFCGAIGVDLFFVISGFIMANSITKKIESGRELSALAFIGRRIRRVYPLYFLLSSLFLIIFLVFHRDPIFYLKQYYLSMLFIPIQNGNKYADPILFAGWSLNFEMIFYIIIAFSILLFRKFCLHIAFSILLLLGLVGLCFTFNNIYVDTIFCNLFLEFALGIIAFWICNKINVKKKFFLNIFFCLSIVVFFVSALGKDSGYGYLGIPRDFIKFSFEHVELLMPRSLIWGIPSFFVFLSTVLFFKDKKQIVALEKLGDISYSMYLVQVPLIWFYDGHTLLVHNNILIVLIALTMCACIVLISLFTHKYIEKEEFLAFFKK